MDLRSLAILIALLLITTAECRRRRRHSLDEDDYDEDDNDNENERSASSQVLQSGGNIIGTAWGTIVPDETNKAAIYGASQQYNPQGAFGGYDYYSNPGGGYSSQRSTTDRHRHRHRRRPHRCHSDDDDYDDRRPRRRKNRRRHTRKFSRTANDDDINRDIEIAQEAADIWAAETGREKMVVSSETLLALPPADHITLGEYIRRVRVSKGLPADN